MYIYDGLVDEKICSFRWVVSLYCVCVLWLGFLFLLGLGKEGIVCSVFVEGGSVLFLYF